MANAVSGSTFTLLSGSVKKAPSRSRASPVFGLGVLVVLLVVAATL